MADLAQRIKNSFDEARLLILVVQVFIGFQMRAPFEPRFASAPANFHTLLIVALGLLLASFVMFVAPAPYLELAYRGEMSTHSQSFASVMLAAGLAPFLAALAINSFVAVTMAVSPGVGRSVAIGFIVVGILAWYALGLLQRTPRPEKRAMTHKASLTDRIEQVMTESRMIVPGAQALLGFQFATVFMAAFDALAPAIKALHVVSMCLVALSTVFLIAPASFHRIAENGEDAERVVTVGSRFVIASLVPLALGIALDVGVVCVRSGLTPADAAVLPGLLIAAAAIAWFLYPAALRRRRASQT